MSVVKTEVGQATESGDQPAERVLLDRLRQAPDDVGAIVELAGLAVGKGAIGRAAALLRRALDLAPDAHDVRAHLAALHQQQAYYPAALALIGQLPPPIRADFDVAAMEGALRGQIGQRAQEIVIYQRLLTERPDEPVLWRSLGSALHFAGRDREAVAALRRAIALRPHFGQAYWELANQKSFRFGDDDVAAMEEGLRAPIADDDRIHLSFALGRAFEGRKDYARSFDHYAAGNRLQKAGAKSTGGELTAQVDRSIETFTADLFAHREGAGDPSDAPIFVVGLQRSGSTLIEQILASHPAIEGTAELPTMQQLWEETMHRAGRDGRDPFDYLAALDPAELRRLGEAYLARTRSFRHLGKPRFVDKLPANWLNLGLIRLILPNARIVDARRHPMACGLSNFNQLYATGVEFSYDLERIGRTYREYLRQMRHFHAVQPGAMFTLTNEALVDDPEGSVRGLLAFVGVPYDAACLAFHENARAVQTPSASQVRRPINRDGVEHWRHYAPWLGPLEAALGNAIDDWQH